MNSTAARMVWGHGGGLLAVALLLSGCAVGPNYRPPSVAKLGVPAAYTTVAPPAAGSADLATWWTQFQDPLLTQLVAEATAGDLDIQVSEARYKQARESLVQARAALFPTLSASASISRTAIYGSSGLSGLGGLSTSGLGNLGSLSSLFGGTEISVGPSASWQPDLFGGVRRSVEASRAGAQAALFNLEGVRTSVASEVATNYIDARLAQARLAIARDTLKSQDDNLQIAGWRVQAGLASATDVEQARAQRAQTAATIPLLQTNFKSAANRLAILTGQAPGALEGALRVVGPIPLGPPGIAIGVPADTLRQRPDVRAAERQLAQATAQIGVAKAQLFPALSLTGSLTESGSNLANLFSSPESSIAAALAQPIFEGGKLRSAVRSARDAAEQAYATYRSTVLSGLEDVENALQALDAAKARQASLAEALDASQAATVLARSQYQSGLTDFLTLLQSQQTLLSARDALVSAQADQATAIVQLYLAVGGGWRPDATSLSAHPA